MLINFRQKNSNMSMGYIKNTVNFELLEEKAKLYLHNKFTKFKKTTKNSF